jgi:hypothetical protein
MRLRGARAGCGAHRDRSPPSHGRARSSCGSVPQACAAPTSCCVTGALVGGAAGISRHPAATYDRAVSPTPLSSLGHRLGAATPWIAKGAP